MIHTNLPIYKKGYDLLTLAADVQLNMPRTFKQSLGKREANATPLEFRDELIRLAMMAHNVRANRETTR